MQYMSCTALVQPEDAAEYMHGKSIYILWPESNERFVAKVVDVDTTARTATLHFDSFPQPDRGVFTQNKPINLCSGIGEDDELFGFSFGIMSTGTNFNTSLDTPEFPLGLQSGGSDLPQNHGDALTLPGEEAAFELYDMVFVRFQRRWWPGWISRICSCISGIQRYDIHTYDEMVIKETKESSLVLFTKEEFCRKLSRGYAIGRNRSLDFAMLFSSYEYNFQTTCKCRRHQIDQTLLATKVRRKMRLGIIEVPKRIKSSPWYLDLLNGPSLSLSERMCLNAHD